jgi:gluconate kinase
VNSKYDKDISTPGLVYDTSFARYLSPSLAAAPVLNQDIVDKFIKNFQSTFWRQTTPSRTAKNLIIINGPCGAGKSTVAKAVSAKYNIPWIEGDMLPSTTSLAKVPSQLPLSDEDSWLWLETIKAKAIVHLSDGEDSSLVIVCSELKKAHREELRRSRILKTVFVTLQCSQASTQLESQEPPGVGETDVIPIDVTAGTDDVIVNVSALLEDRIVF